MKEADVVSKRIRNKEMVRGKDIDSEKAREAQNIVEIRERAGRIR